jgi:molecular chaperone DnaK (HSP70)
MPSLVGFDEDGSVVTGEKAESANYRRLVRSIKRCISEGREFVRLDLPTGTRDVRVDDLIVELLREAGRRGARHGQDIGAGSLVRLGCPAMWDGQQRRRLLGAAQRASLPVVLATLVDEPVAAGIAWLVQQPAADRPSRVLVFDMGGGTLDIALLDVRGHKDVSVLAAYGVAEAGDAFDETIAADLDLELAKAGLDIDALAYPARARAWLIDEARTTKELLTVNDEHVVVTPPHIFGRTVEVWYSRDQLNEAFVPQMERAEVAVAMTLRIAQLAAANATAGDIARASMDDLVRGVDVVLLSGGMCRMPYVKQRLQWLFDDSTTVEPATAQPENAVAIGLAKAGDFGKISMFRPPFDILLEWDHGREFRTVYEAFTPLVERAQIAGGLGDLRYVRSGQTLALPRAARGRLRVVSHTGERLRASLGGRSLDGFSVSFGDGFEFSIYPDGRIRMTDAAGTYDGHVEDWHHLDA